MVVWAQGIDFTDELRHIYQSIDGGASFNVAFSPANPTLMYLGLEVVRGTQ